MKKMMWCLVSGVALATTAYAGDDEMKHGSGQSELQMMDADHDGSVSATEHAAGAKRMFAMMDKDGNGEISKAEFEAFHADHARGPGFARWGGPHPGGMRMRRAMMAHGMFERADLDHDGKVSLAEAEKAALDRFDRIDTNHDGVISEAERDAARAQMAMRWREHRGRHWNAEGPGHDHGPPPPGAPPQG